MELVKVWNLVSGAVYKLEFVPKCVMKFNPTEQ
jgi:hypothetical protein